MKGRPMDYIRLGQSSSELELRAVRDRARGNRDRLCEYVDLLKAIERLEADGIVAGWEPARQLHDVRVFIGDRGSNPTAIWAAVEIGVGGNPATLLKVVDTFDNDLRQHEELLEDALDRKERGTRHG
jgi:hypothetical protein